MRCSGRQGNACRLSERALERELKLIERERGEAFPQRTSELRGGRPVEEVGGYLLGWKSWWSYIC